MMKIVSVAGYVQRLLLRDDMPLVKPWHNHQLYLVVASLVAAVGAGGDAAGVVGDVVGVVGEAAA